LDGKEQGKKKECSDCQKQNAEKEGSDARGFAFGRKCRPVIGKAHVLAEAAVSFFFPLPLMLFSSY
jgi:hypothetical protein